MGKHICVSSGKEVNAATTKLSQCVNNVVNKIGDNVHTPRDGKCGFGTNQFCLMWEG